MRKSSIFLLAIVLLAAWWWLRPAAQQQTAHDLPAVASAPVATTPATEPLLRDAPSGDTDSANAALPGFLPPEAREKLRLIAQGGPFPYRQDGTVFGNREGRLPRQPRDWYHEYTVDTPGLDHRGARRIVTGGAPPSEYWYTDDHYESFRRFEYHADGSTP